MFAEARRWKASAFFYAAACTMAASGCQSFDPAPSAVESQDKAATVLVSPTMVAPWADVSSALKPAFTMTGDAALTHVLPVTEGIQEEALSAFGAGLGLGLPQSSSQKSLTNTNANSNNSSVAGGVTTTTSTSSNGATSSVTKTEAPGAAPTIPTGTPAGGALPTAAAPGALGLDPVLTYKAANYLNQEVQLLNQEVDNAARRDCFIPYVVKLKLAVMTYRPHLPYSIHSRISFFPSMVKSASQYAEARDAPLNCKYAAAHSPVVVPFLAADDIEVAARSRSTEVAQQLSLALNFMAQGVGGNANVNGLKQALKAISNHDLTSTLTVARENDNTLYALIAPNNSASNDPTMVGQTYDVAVLLLVPRDYFIGADPSEPARISIATYTEMRDAIDGSLLPSRAADTRRVQADRIIPQFLQNPMSWEALRDQQQRDIVGNLIDPVIAGNLDTFNQALAKYQGGAAKPIRLPDGSGPSLWAALSTLIDDSSFKSGMFELPVPAPVKIPSQQVLLVDDGAHPIQALIRNVNAQSVASVAAYLELTPMLPAPEWENPKPKKPQAKSVKSKSKPAPPVKKPPTITLNPGETVQLPAQSMALDAASHVLTLTFPSLGKNAIHLDDKTQGEISIEDLGCDPSHSLCPKIEVGLLRANLHILEKPDAKDSAIKLDGAGPFVAIDKTGGGILSVTLTLPAKETAVLTLDGAAVSKAVDSTGKALSFAKGGGYQMPASGAYAFSLFNLVSGSKIAISIQGMSGNSPDGQEPLKANYTAVRSRTVLTGDVANDH